MAKLELEGLEQIGVDISLKDCPEILCKADKFVQDNEYVYAWRLIGAKRCSSHRLDFYYSNILYEEILKKLKREFYAN